MLCHLRKYFHAISLCYIVFSCHHRRLRFRFFRLCIHFLPLFIDIFHKIPNNTHHIIIFRLSPELLCLSFSKYYFIWTTTTQKYEFLLDCVEIAGKCKKKKEIFLFVSCTIWMKILLIFPFIPISYNTHPYTIRIWVCQSNHQQERNSIFDNDLWLENRTSSS